MQTVEQAFARLGRSRFRSRFHLGDSDIAYIREKGMDRIQDHARDFVRTRLSRPAGEGDGKQTPMRGHPVFVAMHATACCCRGCLCKWYRVSPDVPLTAEQQERIVRFLMCWLEGEMERQVRSSDENGNREASSEKEHST